MEGDQKVLIRLHLDLRLKDKRIQIRNRNQTSLFCSE